MRDSPKNPPEFYAARDAAESGTYLKMRTRLLQWHLAELKKRRPWENLPACIGAVLAKDGWLAKLEKEIENRNYARRARASAILDKVVEGLVVAAILAVVGFLSHTICVRKSGPKGNRSESLRPPMEPTNNLSTNVSYSPPLINATKRRSNQRRQRTGGPPCVSVMPAHRGPPVRCAVSFGEMKK